MKKILLSLVFTAVSTFSFGQIKSTGPVALGSAFGLQIDLNSATNTATFSFVGPSSGWMGIGLDATAMTSAVVRDCIQVGTSIYDRRLSGSRSEPITDATNNLTLVSNNVNPNNGVRTVILTRPFNTGDANDYTFNYATITTLPIIWAFGADNDVTNGHAARAVTILTFTTLGIDGHEIKAFSIYPNPTFDSFKIQTEAQINGVVVYDNVGKMVQKFEKATDNYDISKLSKGVYFLEINTVAGQKSYEKIVKE